MAIIENRLSTTLVDDTYIPPEGFIRNSFLHDKEGGPIAVTDTSGGMNAQDWTMTVSPAFEVVLTPDVGAPYSLNTITGAKQASFCFDQNARPSIVWVTDTTTYLYWYDSAVGNFVTTDLGADVISAMLSLDDKRALEVSDNDIILWYTKETSPSVWQLYHRLQRERFTIEYEMTPPAGIVYPPYLWKAGMHEGLRGKVTLTYRTPGS